MKSKRRAALATWIVLLGAGLSGCSGSVVGGKNNPQSDAANFSQAPSARATASGGAQASGGASANKGIQPTTANPNDDEAAHNGATTGGGAASGAGAGSGSNSGGGGVDGYAKPVDRVVHAEVLSFSPSDGSMQDHTVCIAENGDTVCVSGYWTVDGENSPGMTATAVRVWSGHWYGGNHDQILAPQVEVKAGEKVHWFSPAGDMGTVYFSGTSWEWGASDGDRAELYRDHLVSH